jgi:dihydroorotase
MQFDLLIQGGEVIDPAAGYAGQMDVAITHNRIAAVARAIPVTTARQVIDAHDQIVTPGLIDLHTHIYHGATYWGIHPDPIAARTGVTTWVDAGSAGAFNLIGLREQVAKHFAVRVFALINISAIGLIAAGGESRHLELCDAAICARLIDLHPDFIRGVKARMDQSSVSENGVEPLRRARQVAERCARPLMVHIGIAPPAIEQVLELMRPGDILTHCATGHTMRIVDDAGNLLDAARRARDAGVVMDIGHGAGSFAFATIEPLLRAGFLPDVISSDIHQVSVHGPMFDLPTCMSKFLALGMSLPNVIRATTARPAEILGLQNEIGTLRPGALADLAVFRLLRGRFPFYDVRMEMREGTVLLQNTLTILNGRPLARVPDEPSAPWIALNENQRALIERGHTPAMLAEKRP